MSCSRRERARAHDRGLAAFAAYNRRCGLQGTPVKAKCKIVNVSTALTPKFRTADGAARVERVRGGKWRVKPRSGRAVKVNSKAQALDLACTYSRRR